MKLLKPQEAAEQLSVARTLILKWVEEGRLPGVILSVGPSGKRILRIKESDLEAFVKAHENRVQTKGKRVNRLRLPAFTSDDAKAESM
jgi:excisionase family DNA binding protein